MKPISYKQGVGGGRRQDTESFLCLGPQAFLGFRLRDDLLLLVLVPRPKNQEL